MADLVPHLASSAQRDEIDDPVTLLCVDVTGRAREFKTSEWSVMTRPVAGNCVRAHVVEVRAEPGADGGERWSVWLDGRPVASSDDGVTSWTMVVEIASAGVAVTADQRNS